MKYIIKNSDIGITLKKFLQNNFLVTNSQIKKLIDKSNIKINNEVSKYNYVLKENDKIIIYKKLKAVNFNYDFLKSKNDIQIFYEDKNILIINKKEKELCQKSSWEKTNDINSKLKKYLYEKKEWNPSMDFSPNLCHRIDCETKGLVIAAKNKNAMNEVLKGFKNKSILKIYVCFVLGKLKNKSGEIKSFIVKDKNKNNLMKVDCNKDILYNSICKYKVIEESESFSIVKVFLQNGKKHQIRIQLKEIGNPILGDYKYNKIENKNFKTLCLWSYEIIFCFPSDSKLRYLNNIKFKLKDDFFNLIKNK